MECCRHSALLTEGQGANDKVSGSGGLRNRDYAAHPLAMGRIHTVLLVVLPETKGKSLQQGSGEEVGEARRLCLSAEFSKVEVFSLWTQPVARKNTGVGVCGLSIKLDSQWVDGDGDIGVEETLHAKRAREQGGLGKVFVFGQREEWAVEVPVRDEDDCVVTGVRPERQNACNGSLGCHKGAVVTGTESLFDAGAIHKGEEGYNEMIRMWDGVYVDGVMLCRGVVGKVDDGGCPCRGNWEGEGVEDSGMGPGETRQDAEHRKRGGE